MKSEELMEQPSSRDEATRRFRESMARLNKAAHNDPLALQAVATNLERRKQLLR